MSKLSASFGARWRNEALLFLPRLDAVGDKFAKWETAYDFEDDFDRRQAPQKVLRYHDIEREFWALLRKANLGVEPENWLDWLVYRKEFIDEMPDSIAKARLSTIAVLVVSLQQMELHEEGGIARAYEDGVLSAIIERLIEISEHLPYDALTGRWAYERTDRTPEDILKIETRRQRAH